MLACTRLFYIKYQEWFKYVSANDLLNTYNVKLTIYASCMITVVISSYRRNLKGQRYLLLLGSCGTIYILWMSFLVLVADYRGNNMQICTMKTYYLQEVLYYYSKQTVTCKFVFSCEKMKEI